MTVWRCQRVPFKFQLSDLTVFSYSLPLQVCSIALADQVEPVACLAAPDETLPSNTQGYCMRAVPIAANMQTITRDSNYIRYVVSQYRHCFIDFRQSFADYEKKFSSKSRSTIKRKIRKYAEHCGGAINWRTYRHPGELAEFLRFARQVSAKTYQEKLLEAGIPDSPGFVREMETLAAEDRIRAFVLFDGERPVSYLYCPVIDSVVIYSYLGYDPEFMKLSVGTVLQWLAVEALFAEQRYKFFDFTEGESDHKRLFATHDVQCANVIWLRRSVANEVLIRSHRSMDQLSRLLGHALDRVGMKRRLKHFLRFFGR